MKKAEVTVRNYLTYIKNPSALVDRDALAKTRNELKETTDAIDRLRLQSEIERLKKPDSSELESAFIAVAKDWGTKNGISLDAFLAEGVSAQVLTQAGYNVTAREAGGKTRRRRSRVSAAAVRAAFTKEAFSIQDITVKTGASSGMVRKVILEAVDEKVIKSAGKDPNHTGPGRARLLYQLL